MNVMLNNLTVNSTDTLLSMVTNWPCIVESFSSFYRSPEKAYKSSLNSMNRRRENGIKRSNSLSEINNNARLEDTKNLTHSNTFAKLNDMDTTDRVENPDKETNDEQSSVESIKNRLTLDQQALTDVVSKDTRWSIPVENEKKHIRRYSPEGSSSTNSAGQWSPLTVSPNSTAKSEKSYFDKRPSDSGPTKLSAAAQIKNFLAPNYKSRNDEFKRLFKMPESEKFITAYSCAFQREILCQGRMYISQNWLCFYANIFRWETTIVVSFKDIKCIKKRRTAKVIPNAIEVTTKNGEKLFFTSFTARGKTYLLLTKMLHLSRLDQNVQPEDIWAWIRRGYDANNSGSQDEGNAIDGTNINSKEDGSQLKDNDDKISDNDNNSDRQVDDKSIPDCGEEAARNDGKSRSTRNRNSSLMLNIPSLMADDYSDSSENEHEIVCPCDSHHGKEYVNEVFPLSADQMFLLLFTDNPFYRKLQASRKNTNHVLNEWEEDKSSGGKTREITYTAALNYSMGPKSCEVTDTQVCSESSKSGHVYVVYSLCHQVGIPYGDTFDIRNTYCITRVTSNSCRLKGHGGTVYRKTCWSFIKNLIEKNAEIGLSAYYTDLLKHLRMECSQANSAKSDLSTQRKSSEKRTFIAESKKKKVKRNKPKSPISLSTPRNQSFPGLEEIESNSHLKLLTKTILLILIAMLILNSALFYKLWYFESESERLLLEANMKEFNSFIEKTDLSSAQEWLSALKHEGFNRREILHKFAHTVSNIAEIEKSLLSLKRYIKNIQNEFSSYSYDVSQNS